MYYGVIGSPNPPPFHHHSVEGKVPSLDPPPPSCEYEGISIRITKPIVSRTIDFMDPPAADTKFRYSEGGEMGCGRGGTILKVSPSASSIALLCGHKRSL